MPSHRHHDFGNLFIQFDVKFPEKNWTTNPEHFETLKSILPPTVQPITPPIDVEAEQADLEEMDPQSQSRAAHGMGDDDEDMEGGQPGVRILRLHSLRSDSNKHRFNAPNRKRVLFESTKIESTKKTTFEAPGLQLSRPRLYAFRKLRFAIWDRSSSWLATAIKRPILGVCRAAFGLWHDFRAIFICICTFRSSIWVPSLVGRWDV